jgi:hypothetical protein
MLTGLRDGLGAELSKDSRKLRNLFTCYLIFAYSVTDLGGGQCIG